MGSAQPSVEFTRRKYVEAHDVIVASAAYTSALETAHHVLQKASLLSALAHPLILQRPWIRDRIPTLLPFSMMPDYLQPAIGPNASRLGK